MIKILMQQKEESTGWNHFNNSNVFIEYSNIEYVDDIYKSIEQYTLTKKRKILIVFDDMISDMLCNEKPNPIVTEFIIRGWKLNMFLVLVRQSYFAAPKDIRLNSTHCFIMKIPKKESFSKLHLIIHQIMTLKTL